MRIRAEVEVELLLLRHGRTESNKQGRYLGRTEECLSDQGRKEVLQEQGKRKYAAPKWLFTSPMLRCVQTAALLFPKKEPVLISEWLEIDFGSFEGKTCQELADDSRYRAWLRSGGTLPFPGGESREEFLNRTWLGWNYVKDMLLKNGNQSASVCAVVHGGTIMALLSIWKGGGYFDFQVKNLEGYSLRLLCREDSDQIMEMKKIC